jgi:hypothetical protein
LILNTIKPVESYAAPKHRGESKTAKPAKSKNRSPAPPRKVYQPPQRRAEPSTPKYGLGARAGLWQSDSLGLSIMPGGEVLYFIAPDWTLGGWAGFTNQDIAEDVQKEFGDSINVDKGQAQVAQFAGFLYYSGLPYVTLGSGVSVRTMAVALGLKANDSGTVFDLSVDTWGVMWDFDVSSMYKFDNGFYVGVDWFGISIPLLTGKNIGGEAKDSPDLDQDLKAAQAFTESLGSTLAKDKTYRLLVVSGGYRF